MEKMHALVTCLGVSRGNMEQGNLRADANVSLRPVGESKLGTRTETKNLNSFRFVRDAFGHEIGPKAGGGRIRGPHITPAANSPSLPHVVGRGGKTHIFIDFPALLNHC